MAHQDLLTELLSELPSLLNQQSPTEEIPLLQQLVQPAINNSSTQEPGNFRQTTPK